jgi:cytochrome c oxidase subunit IV
LSIEKQLIECLKMAAESMKTAHPMHLHHWCLLLLHQFVGHLPDYFLQQVLLLLLLLVVLVGQDGLLEVLVEEAVA